MNPSATEILGIKSNWEPLVRTHPDGPYGEQIFVNNLYQVNARQHDENLVHLSIKRLDKKPAKNWRHFQYIKNQLCGDEACGIEIYPPESVLVDTVNQYHMMVMDKACFPPILFQERLVSEHMEPYTVQEPWEPNMRPKDLVPGDKMKKLVDDYKKEIGLNEFQ